MRFSPDGGGEETLDRPCFWEDKGSIWLIDQRSLPSRVSIIEASSVKEQVEAIKTLSVRGAPAIGCFGALSLSLAISRGDDPYGTYNALLTSRPTAVDLRNCLDMVMEAFDIQGPEGAALKARSLIKKTIASCRSIGDLGAGIIPDNARVMTHCNAGALATIEWGTALAPIRMKARSGGKPFVWVSETRPLLQGSRLTAWELEQEGIDHAIFVDSASSFLMEKGKVDLIITGADRICRNGDTANKVGTYGKAIAAREHGIPFYIAAPSTTMDPSCENGSDVVIELRSEDEITCFNGISSAPEGSRAYNPAFDITPGDFITAYITDRGVFDPDGLKALM